MQKKQIYIITAALLMLPLLYFFVPNAPPKSKKLAPNSTEGKEVKDIDIQEALLLQEAKQKYTAAQLETIRFLDGQLRDATTDSLKLLARQKISGAWYALKAYGLAGIEAERIANIENTAQAWSLAGTSYGAGIAQATNVEEKQLCLDRAILAFEKAITLEPDNIYHRINLSECYVMLPPADNPMKGILMLRELAARTEYPDNIPVELRLAKKGIEIGKYENAIARLNTVLDNEPQNTNALILMVEAHKASGNDSLAVKYMKELQAIDKK